MAELFYMAEARKRLQWEPLALFMCLFVNAHKDPKKKPARIDDFFPFHIDKKRRYEDLPKAHITDLKHMFRAGVKNAP